MLYIRISILICLFAVVNSSLSGPYLMWGHEKVINLQPKALVEATEENFSSLYKSAKAIIIFVRSNARRLEGTKYPKFQNLIQNNAWVYLPQHSLKTEPYNYNTNIEVINLEENEDNIIVAKYNETLGLYGEGEVLGILANREYENQHQILKREAKKDDSKKPTEEKEGEAEEEKDKENTTALTPLTEETEKSFIYVASGKKAILYVNSAPMLNLSNSTLKLVEHNKEITFDDQKQNGYGRLNVVFNVDREKIFLRFNFTLLRGSWYIKSVEVADNAAKKKILPIVGNQFMIPSAPIGFSYRCSSRPMIFRNGSDSLVIHDYQIQPWLNGAEQFGEVFHCVGFFTVPILMGIIVTMLLGVILTFGMIMLLDIKPPTRFESSRSKTLTIDVQE